MQSATLNTGALRTHQITESVFREITRLAAVHKAINLGPGLPDSLIPSELINAGHTAFDQNIHQYAVIFGDRLLREAVAADALKTKGKTIDPDTQVTITCGATEAISASMMALIDPGDEVIIFEPFYESYGPNTVLCGATPRYVKLNPPDWKFDEAELEKAFNNKTRAIIINSPVNPTGTVFSREELQAIARLCQKWGVTAITDEIYEHIVYPGAEHISLASLPGMEDRTVTTHSLSKTFCVTGWRVGWAIASPEMTVPIRKVHDYLTAGTAAPLQRAAATALGLGQEYYKSLATEYAVRRDRFLETLNKVGLPHKTPSGAYYVLADISGFGFANSFEFTKNLIEKVGVAAVPGNTFFRNDNPTGNNFVRFCFARKPELLDEACQRLLAGNLHKS